MKLVARINGEDPELALSLKMQGLRAKVVRGAVIVDLRIFNNDGRKYRYHVPLDGAILLIDCAESTSVVADESRKPVDVAVVVCGLTSGRRLRPYFVPRDGSDRVHARFAIPGGVVSVAARKDGMVVIREHRIIDRGATAWIEDNLLWGGKLEKLPGMYSHLRPAAEAAIEKANCAFCECVHWAEEGPISQPARKPVLQQPVAV